MGNLVHKEVPKCFRLARFSWRAWAIIAFAGLLLGVLALQLDAVVDTWLRAVPDGRTAAQFLSQTAKGHWPLIVGSVAFAAAWYFRRADWRRVALIFLLATTLAGVSASVLRGAFGRARPSNRVEQGWFGPYHNGRWTITNPAYNAFPSGHTATAASCAFALILVGRRIGWLVAVWAVAVAWARIYPHAHPYPNRSLPCPLY